MHTNESCYKPFVCSRKSIRNTFDRFCWKWPIGFRRRCRIRNNFSAVFRAVFFTRRLTLSASEKLFLLINIASVARDKSYAVGKVYWELTPHAWIWTPMPGCGAAASDLGRVWRQWPKSALSEKVANRKFLFSWDGRISMAAKLCISYQHKARRSPVWVFKWI